MRCWRGGNSGSLDNGGSGVIQRTQQSGYVAQWAGLGAPLRQRSRRFALEVPDVHVTACTHHLAVMKVAMYAAQQFTLARTGKGLKRGRQIRAAPQQPSRPQPILRPIPLHLGDHVERGFDLFASPI